MVDIFTLLLLQEQAMAQIWSAQNVQTSYALLP